MCQNGLLLLGARPGVSPVQLFELNFQWTQPPDTAVCLRLSLARSLSLSGAGNAKNTSDLAEPDVTDGGVRRNQDWGGV